MSFREKISKNQSLVGVIAGVVIVGAVISIFWQARNAANAGKQAYFTTDDGATYFTDSKDKIPPYTKDGKEAVRAHVFMCGGKPVVGYLSRYSKEALQMIEEVKIARAEKRPPKNVGALMSLSSVGIEVKKPGAGNPWVKGTDTAKVAQIRAFKCPGEKASRSEIDPG